MSEPGKNSDQIAKIMSSAKRDCSPSVELVDIESPDEQNPEENECTESEQELSTSKNEPQSRQTSSRNVNETTVCWKFLQSLQSYSYVKKYNHVGPIFM